MGSCPAGTKTAGGPSEPPGKSADSHEVGARLRAHFARGCSVLLGCARSRPILTWRTGEAAGRWSGGDNPYKRGVTGSNPVAPARANAHSPDRPGTCPQRSYVATGQSSALSWRRVRGLRCACSSTVSGQGPGHHTGVVIPGYRFARWPGRIAIVVLPQSRLRGVTTWPGPPGSLSGYLESDQAADPEPSRCRHRRHDGQQEWGISDDDRA